MFGNLIESGSHKVDRARKGKFFLSALAIYTAAFMAIGVAGIYAYDTHVSPIDLSVVSMVTPVETPAVQMLHFSGAPGRPAGNNGGAREIVLKEKPTIAFDDPTLAKANAPVSRHGIVLPPGTVYRLDPNASDNIFGGPGIGTREGGGGGSNTRGGGTGQVDEIVKDAPPPEMKVETKKQPAVPLMKSMGVVNGMATYLPKPVYSQIAKAAHASGTVTVQVVINESGKVISAKAIGGNPLLQKESVQAAYQARFTPTLLSNQPVKVTGIITYNFVMG